MKGIYVIAIAFLASVSAANTDQSQLMRSVVKKDVYGPIRPIPTVCPVPEQFPMNTTTNLAHETDCTKFYKCHMGERIETKCALMTPGDPITRLHYNRLEQVCDWPWQAGCAQCPLRYRNGTYPNLSLIGYPANNCNQYYECVNGVPNLRSCPVGTCFSRTCQACVANRNGGSCGSSPPITPTPPTPTPPVGCINGDSKRHDCDCGKYYQCINPDWIETECGGGLHYSPIKKTCLPPDEAGCL